MTRSTKRPAPHARHDVQSGAALLRRSIALPAAALLGAAVLGSAALLGSAPANATVTSVFSARGTLGTARAHAVAVVLANGQVLIAGGQDASGAPLATAELYDPGTGTFHPTGSLPTAVTDATATRLDNGDVLVVGGLTGTPGNLTVTGSAAIYNPGNGTWTAAQAMPAGVVGATTALLPSGQVLVAGGRSGAGANATVTAASELYLPGSNTWSATGSLPTPVADAASAQLLNGEVLVAGGVTTSASGPSVTSAASLYVPGTGTWHAVANLPLADAEATATRLASGNVLVAGGETTVNGSPTAWSEVFDPETNTWYHAQGLPNATYGATATRLASGQVLYAGGFAADGSPSATASLYDPQSAQWSPAASLLLGRGFASAVRLSDGSVLIVGGVTSAGVTGESELYGLPATKAAAITSASSWTSRAGVAASFTLSATGTPTPTLSESGVLPAGLGFHPGPNGTATISGTPTPKSAGSYQVTITASNGVGASASQSFHLVISPAAVPVPAFDSGYWYATFGGELIGKGAASPIAPHSPQRPRDIVAVAATPDQHGYYLVSSFGGVFSYGDAAFYGSIAGLHLRTPTVAFAVNPSGQGYYLVTRAGNVFTRGGARFYGSLAGHRVPPIVAFAVAPGDSGYWLVSRFGNVYAFGSARFYGSTANRRVPPITAFGATADGHGYWLVSARGNIFNFGDARFYGSTANRRVPPITAFAPSLDGHGYWLVSAQGNIFNFGDARFYGSSATVRLPGTVTGFAPQR